MKAEGDSTGGADGPAITMELLVGRSPSDELEGFLEGEWAAWHAAQGHDPTVDWSGSSIAIVARDADGTIVGAAKGGMSAGIGHLRELMTAAHRRGEGVGSELVRQFEERCWSSGCHKLTVHTEHGGPAHRFYQARDWDEEAIFRRDRSGRDFVRLCKFIEDQRPVEQERH